MVIGYFIIGFIIFFFMYKKYYPTLKKRSKSTYDPWVEFKEFWIMLLVPIFWIFAIPLYFFWLFLDYIYERYINKNKTGDAENR